MRRAKIIYEEIKQNADLSDGEVGNGGELELDQDSILQPDGGDEDVPADRSENWEAGKDLLHEGQPDGQDAESVAFIVRVLRSPIESIPEAALARHLTAPNNLLGNNQTSKMSPFCRTHHLSCQGLVLKENICARNQKTSVSRT